MQELLLNQWVNYSILILNAIVAGQVLWFAINIKKSNTVKTIIFTVGLAYAVSIGGLFKAPGFIVQPEVETFWLFLNAIIGLYIIYKFFSKSNLIPATVSYVAIVLSLIGATIVFGGIQEFGMRYMPTILFFTICIYSGVGLIIYQFKVAIMQKMQKRLAYVAAGLVFTVVCLSAFDTYTLVRDTSYTGISEGWEGGVTKQQDELSN